MQRRLSHLRLLGFSKFYGVKPLHCVGGQKRRNFHPLFSMFKMDRIIAEERLYFGKDVEVILIPEDKKPPPSGRAYRSLVWDQFLVCSILSILPT